MESPIPPDARYAERETRFGTEARRLARLGRRTGVARLVAFVGAAWAPLRSVAGEVSGLEGWLSGIAALVFVVLVLYDQRLGRGRRRAEALAEVNARARARLRRDFAGLGAPTPAPAEAPPWARELHLFGPTSLGQLLGTVATEPGRQTLARWLLDGADPRTVAGRQERVRRLAPRLAERQELEAAGRLSGGGGPQLERFFAWAEGKTGLPPLVVWAARLATPLPLAALAATIAGVLPASALSLMLAGVYAGSLVFHRRMGETLDAATAGTDGFKDLGEVFRAAEGLALGREERPSLPSNALARLERLNDWAEARRSVAHPLLQVFLLWDFHVVGGLEAWRRRHGARVRGWLAELGELEALAALAELAHAHPDWAFPVVDASLDRLSAQDLGHPLLADGPRVGNDAALGPSGTFLFITGSNMSGKTTFLRSLGTNAVLALAGGPVAARELHLPPVALATSIAVEDSLAEGVSFFLAELQRLKAVVDLAVHPPAGRRVLYLLDEVLRGTNSAERRVAVARILSRLLATGAFGALTTHDLEVLAEGELESAAVAIHFRERLETDAAGVTRMSFDYRARPGLAPTTNALRLLAAVGLGDEP